MDKPRHPLVTRPWKIQQAQRTKCNLPQIKAGKERGAYRFETAKKPYSKKIREQGSKKTV
jgi:hypothetical protein